MQTQSRELYHIGVKHRSGRYPYGSGDRPYQDRETARAEEYRKKEIGKIDKYAQKANRRFVNSSVKYKQEFLKNIEKEGRKGLAGATPGSRSSEALKNYRRNLTGMYYMNMFSVAERNHMMKLSVDELNVDRTAKRFVDKTFDRVGEQKLEELYLMASNRAMEDTAKLAGEGLSAWEKAARKNKKHINIADQFSRL